MRIRWYGQSAYTLSDGEHTVTIDPFAGMPDSLRERFRYPDIPAHSADLLLITHEHADHNGADVVTGDPHTVRATAGRFDTPVGTVTGVASEHDDQAGTSRGPNTIFVFPLDGRTVCHFGDFGQPALRPEQRAAIGEVDLLFIPIGGGPTLDDAQAAAVVAELRPSWVVPMHYRTPAIDFLEPADAFLARFDRTTHAPEPEYELTDWNGATAVLHLAPPA